MNEHFTQAQKIHMVKTMWQVAYSDAQLDAHENHLISMIAGLLHVTHGEYLGACRAWGVESENRPQRGQFLPDLQAHSPAMGQKDGEKWTAAVDLQPTIPKSDRLLGAREAAGHA